LSRYVATFRRSIEARASRNRSRRILGVDLSRLMAGVVQSQVPDDTGVRPIDECDRAREATEMAGTRLQAAESGARHAVARAPARGRWMPSFFIFA
jgi:hypothetical protein